MICPFGPSILVSNETKRDKSVDLVRGAERADRPMPGGRGSTVSLACTRFPSIQSDEGVLTGNTEQMSCGLMMFSSAPVAVKKEEDEREKR